LEQIPVPKLDLGQKQMCPSCGAKFYDLGKRPAKCPKCGNTFDPDDELVVATRQAARMSSLDVEETSIEEDDDEDVVVNVKAIDPDAEEEIDVEEVTKEIDIEAMDDGDLIMGSDGDDDEDVVGGSDSIPEGFSEQDLDEDEELVDEEIPFIEGEDELLEEELGDLDLDDLDEGKEP
jgi:uncharacterized protein (TIGR02300 family)